MSKIKRSRTFDNGVCLKPSSCPWQQLRMQSFMCHRNIPCCKTFKPCAAGGFQVPWRGEQFTIRLCLCSGSSCQEILSGEFCVSPATSCWMMASLLASRTPVLSFVLFARKWTLARASFSLALGFMTSSCRTRNSLLGIAANVQPGWSLWQKHAVARAPLLHILMPSRMTLTVSMAARSPRTRVLTARTRCQAGMLMLLKMSEPRSILMWLMHHIYICPMRKFSKLSTAMTSQKRSEASDLRTNGTCLRSSCGSTAASTAKRGAPVP